jgi:hypothetical protein
MTKPRRHALWEALLSHVKPVPRKHWPKFVRAEFEQMNTGLKSAVESAVRRATEVGSVDDWVWDAYDGVFRFNVRVVILSKVRTAAITVTSRFIFDPRKAWRGEVERVMIEAEEFVRLLCAAVDLP